jgi:hypothetical protein
MVGEVGNAKARVPPSCSSERVAHHSMACPDYVPATELYGENARGRKVSEDERKNSEIAARLTRSCIELTSTKRREE